MDTRIKGKNRKQFNIFAILFIFLIVLGIYSVYPSKIPLSFFKITTNITEKILGKKHPKTAITYYNLSFKYSENGDYLNGLKYMKMSLNIREAFLSENQPDTLVDYYQIIASLYKRTGDEPKSLQYTKKNLRIREKILLNEQNSTSADYYDIAYLCSKIGEHVKALKYYKISLEKKEKSLGARDRDLVRIYHNIAYSYEQIGNYNEAIQYNKKTLDIRKKLFGNNHPDIASSYNNLATTYSELGDYGKALEFHKLSEKIREKILGKEHPDTAISYDNLASVYNDLGEYSKALEYNKKTLDIRKKLFGNNHPDTASSYNSLATTYSELGDYGKALQYCKASLEIRENILGKDHEDTASSYNNLSFLYLSMGFYKKALTYSLTSLSIYENILEKDNPLMYVLYNNLATNYIGINNQKAYINIQKAFSIFLHNRDKNFLLLDNTQKKMYLKRNNYDEVFTLFLISYLYSVTNSTVKEEVSQETLNNWLNYKGSIFDSENTIITLYQSTKDTVLKEKINNLISHKRVLSKLYQTLPEPKEQDIWKEKITKEESKIAFLTNEISSKAQSLKEQQGLKNIAYQDIALNLKEDELYIDYAKAGDHYYLFSLDNKENITFKRIDENSTKKIDNLVKTFREDVQSILNNKMSEQELKQLTVNSKEKLSKLYDLVLKQPLSSILKNKENLIISSDGALKLLPFEAMFDTEKNQYLIEQKEIRYIPSGKELVRLYKYGQHNSGKETRDTVIFSDPDFNARGKLASLDEEEISVTPNTSRAGIVKSLFKMRFQPLPGTKTEAEEIKHTLVGDHIVEYKQTKASEANLMKIKEPKILHIATHGFFINDKNIPNPMLKSGIALSGANTSAIKGQSEGIVTALKLSGLDLKGTDLVVLSACQTGVVDINDTESVSGLSKAFIQAGAKDIIMSLWSVDDEATKNLMSSFYKQTIGNKEYDKALKEAKLEMIREDRHPFYWAAFVLNGL